MRCGKRVKYWQIIFHIDWKCQQFCSTAWCCVCLPACAVNLLWWVIVMSSICFSPGIRCLRKIVVSSTCWWTNEWLIWSPWLAKDMTLSTYHIAMDWQASTPILCHFQWHILVVTHKHTRKPFDVVSVAKTIQNCSSTGRGLICHLICILQASLVLNRIECRRKNFSVTFFSEMNWKRFQRGFFFSSILCYWLRSVLAGCVIVCSLLFDCDLLACHRRPSLCTENMHAACSA